MERTLRRIGPGGGAAVTQQASREADHTVGADSWDLTLAQLQALGREVGFDAIGATTADPFPELIPVLEEYAQRGLTGFESDDILRRIDPKAWLPEARSLIAVAMAYLTDAGQRTARQHPREGLVGQVSVYAYGEDYHRVMARRLDDLQRRLEARLGRPVMARRAIDTAPLVDRRVAERAGIGWVGHNCHVFTPEHGSFVFLGTLLVDVRIEPAAVEQQRPCGQCRLCLDACPTGALVAPGVIDATRCLSYVTQMKGLIPEPFRRPLGRRVWGCDTCQWACPENAHATPASHSEYLPLGELAYPDLVDILNLHQRGFQRRYGATAAGWRGLRTWQRNALIALGNSRRPEAVSHILPFLRHDRRELRASAAWALRSIGGDEGKRAVSQAHKVELDAEVRADMDWATQPDV